MSHFIYFIVVLTVILPAFARSQQGGKKSNTEFSGYKFAITIDSEKRTELRVYTGYENNSLSTERVTAILNEYIAMQTPAVGKKALGPDVSVRPHPTVDIKTVVNVAKSARVSSSAKVWIVTADGSTLGLPVNPKFITNKHVRPNPLTLAVNLLASGDVTLNEEKVGSLSDLSVLTTKLADIFKHRSDTGAYREGTIEVEKHVWVVIPLTATVADLNKIANSINDAGSYEISLLVDDPPWTSTRKSLSTF